jgi:hypothetical protein
LSLSGSPTASVNECIWKNSKAEKPRQKQDNYFSPHC